MPSSLSPLTRRSALRLIGLGTTASLIAACASPQQTAQQPPQAAQTPASGAQQAAPAAASGQPVSLRWFFWTGTEEEVQFWQSLAADAMQHVPNVDVKFETDTFTNCWTTF